MATTDIKAALDGAKVILVSTNGDDHPQVARDLAPHLRDGQIIVLIQGHFCGTLVFRKALTEAGCKAKVDVCEMDGYPYMMTVRSPDRVEMTTDKAMYQLVAVPASRSNGDRRRDRPRVSGLDRRPEPDADRLHRSRQRLSCLRHRHQCRHRRERQALQFLRRQHDAERVQPDRGGRSRAGRGRKGLRHRHARRLQVAGDHL